MKKIIYITLFLTGPFILFASCKKNDDGFENHKKEDSSIVSTPVLQPPFFNKFAIGIYVAPPSDATDKDYAAIRDAHVDFIQDISETTSDSEKKNMLGLAARHDLKMIVANYRVNGDIKDIEQMVKIFGKYPATMGYYVKDEPLQSELGGYANTYKRILSLDSLAWPFVNLFPNYATGALAGIGDYGKNYVEKWITSVGAGNLKFLAFDNYPYVSSGDGDDGGIYRWNLYFENLDIVRLLGIKYHIRTASFLQSIGNSNDDGNGTLRRPNENELRYSAFSILAYGVTVPIWFTYWRPNGSFSPAIVDGDGSKTNLYNLFKQINLEMHQLGKTLINLNAIHVYHIGENPPLGSTKPPKDFYVKIDNSEDNAVILTDFRTSSLDSNYLMVVNKSLTDAKTFSFKVASDVLNIKQISKVTGKPEDSNFSISSHVFSDTFKPGEGKLYFIEKK